MYSARIRHGTLLWSRALPRLVIGYRIKRGADHNLQHGRRQLRNGLGSRRTLPTSTTASSCNPASSTAVTVIDTAYPFPPWLPTTTASPARTGSGQPRDSNGPAGNLRLSHHVQRSGLMRF